MARRDGGDGGGGGHADAQPRQPNGQPAAAIASAGPQGRQPPAAGERQQPLPCTMRTVRVGARTYYVVAVRFANGDFVSVSEGSPPPSAGMGSMAVSMSTPGLPPATTMVIPSKHDGLFLRLAAEHVSHLNAGISVVSCSTRGALGADAARAVMSEMAEMVRRSA